MLHPALDEVPRCALNFGGLQIRLRGHAGPSAFDTRRMRQIQSRLAT